MKQERLRLRMAALDKALRYSFGLVVWVSVEFCFALTAGQSHDSAELVARVVATGIPGAGAITAVGTFHPGGPIHDKPQFAAFTEPGALLDSSRILVSSTSNFGAPLARRDLPEGTVLSIDPRGEQAIVVPARFADSGGQATALSGRVKVLTANNAAFLNSVYNPNAVTADLPPIGNPTGISLNNAFGRIWITSMPNGANGAGIHSIIDADGCPLNGAPDKVAGGVFTGHQTNRRPQVIQGSMASGALASALLGKSPDGGGRAVFASLHADGSLVQLHTEEGVDGLAPPGTIAPMKSGDKNFRIGMIFNWVPDPVLYVSDPTRNAIVAVALRGTGKTFVVESTHRITSAALNVPGDMAPAVSEIASPLFSSNTTLAGSSDIYVVNHGDGTILRLRQNGDTVASRSVVLPGVGRLGPNRLNGIAVSPDASKIWLTISGSLPGYPDGSVIEVSAFGGVTEGRRD